MAGMKCLVAMTMLVVSCYGAAVPVTKIKVSSEAGVQNQCNSSHTISKMAEYQIMATGDSTDVNCTFKFTAVTDGDCQGICYMFNPVAVFKTQNARLIVNSGGITTTYSNETNLMNTLVVCCNETTIDFNLQQDNDYEQKKTKEPYNYTEAADPPEDIENYRFILDVYNACGPRKNVSGITFEEAVKHVDGYHHGEEREIQERNTFLSGILLGFGLSCIFLMVFLIAFCYVRNSPNRGNRSCSMLAK